ncbi:hypothetical protein HMP09_0610 [Sphingomonas sp. HMP9]|uniref:hypothetical protein n=1 Tax=Sphingomonas sp. HMP9 TaxID=1517554 RepID=UPI001596C8E8|nr:hypothetical protein [Sphingomonas sp. HMP9]BCA61376.1 hypothetical protein HMP09_0610 [Sphingomonas sp. HMP9]
MFKRPVLVAIALLTAIGVTAPAIAASSNQFDLVCKGKEQKRTGVPATAWTERFRIDLDAKRWCRGACKVPAAISTVTADEIVINDSRASIGGPSDTELRLSRTTGKVSESVMMGWSGSGASLAEGDCRREFFTDFPSQRF